jgi:hypothetical protein
MFGLRSKNGISRDLFRKISSGKELEESLNISALNQYIKDGYLELNDKKLFPTSKGLKILDGIIRNITS